MRIFLLWAEKPGNLDLRILLKEFKSAGHTLSYFVGYTGAENLVSDETVFHSYQDAINGKPAERFSSTQFAPLDEETIRAFYHTESIVLSMMNRFFDKVPVDERKRRYYELLRYWLGVFRELKPGAVLFPNMPHFVYDYISYEVAKYLGVITLFFDDTRFPGRLLVLRDLSQGSERFKEEQTKVVSETVTVDDLAPDIRGYYESRSNKGFTAVPSYIADQKKKYSLFHKLFPIEQVRKSGKGMKAFLSAPGYARALVREHLPEIKMKIRDTLTYPFVHNLKTEYERVATIPDFSRPYVYFPLQKQPERTTSPQGDMFVDQLLALEILSASLPVGVTIFTKEHPLQWPHFGIGFSSFRYRGFYERIARIPHIVIVPVNTSSYALINGALAVSAVTGSAGFEAVLRGKPAVIFGTVWYEDCPGIFKVQSVASAKDAFLRIQNGGGPEQKRIIQYLKAFERASIVAYISSTAGKASNVSKEECMKNIAKAVVNELA